MISVGKPFSFWAGFSWWTWGKPSPGVGVKKVCSVGSGGSGGIRRAVEGS